MISNRLKQEIAEVQADFTARNIGWKPILFLKVGSGKLYGQSHRHYFSQEINQVFSKNPSARARIYQGLYTAGMFSDWIDGFGIVEAYDEETALMYQKQWEDLHL